MSDSEHLDPSQMTDDEYISNVISLKIVPPELVLVYGAGFWHRGLARLIDIIFHLICSLIALLPSTLFLGIYAGIMNTDFNQYLDKLGKSGTTLIVFLFTLTGAIMFHSISEGINGASLGKRICGLVVISEKQDLCCFKAAFGRSITFYIDSLFFGAVGAVHMSDTQLRQRLGDKWNHTIVCRRKDVQPSILESKCGFFKVFLFAFVVDVTLQSIGFILKAIY
jgi:uncharacterized RDD family membrane protein YckC